MTSSFVDDFQVTVEWIMITDVESVDVASVELAGRGRRLTATIVDALIYAVGPVTARILGVIGLSVVGRFFSTGWYLIMLVIQVRYLAIRGQSVGKIVMKVAIVDPESKVPPGYLRAAVIRQMPAVLLQWLYPPFFVLAYLVVDGVLIFAPNRRCIHDYIARTQVIAVGDDWQ